MKGVLQMIPEGAGDIPDAADSMFVAGPRQSAPYTESCGACPGGCDGGPKGVKGVKGTFRAKEAMCILPRCIWAART